MADKIFAEGIYFNEKNEKQPDFVLGSVSILKLKFVEWLAQQTPDEKGYVKLSILTSKSTGKPYMELDTWKPKSTRETAEEILGF